jgi:hypothetical protein
VKEDANLRRQQIAGFLYLELLPDRSAHSEESIVTTYAYRNYFDTVESRFLADESRAKTGYSSDHALYF